MHLFSFISREVVKISNCAGFWGMRTVTNQLLSSYRYALGLPSASCHKSLMSQHTHISRKDKWLVDRLTTDSADIGDTRPKEAPKRGHSSAVRRRATPLPAAHYLNETYESIRHYLVRASP